MKLKYLSFALIICSFNAFSQCPVANSCTPGTATNAGQGFAMGIYNVTFNTINKSSGGDVLGYQNYSCTDKTTVLAGNSYSISVTTGTNIQENVRIWIDYDNNGTFNASTELVFSSDNKFVHTGNITISNTAVTATLLRMRIAADYSGSAIPTPCSTPQYSQTEDYGITINTNSNPPTPLFTVNDTLSCTGNFQFTDLSQNVPTSWKWYFGDGNVSVLQNPTYTYTTPGKYSVKLVVTNSAGADSLVKTDYVRYSTFVPVSISCNPITTSYCCGYGIYRVRFNTIDNSSSDATEGYKNFTCSKSTQVLEGNTYALTINTSTANNQDTRVWIDYNNNGIFDSNELIFTSLNSKNPTVNYRIPTTGVVYDTPLRMRISSDFVGSSFGPCSNLTHGQAEDYTIVVTQNTNPPVAQFTSNNVTPCDSVVSFIDQTQNAVTTWKWYFGDGDSSSVQNPTHTYRTIGTYNVTLIVTGPFGADTLEKNAFVIYSGGPRAASCIPTTANHCCDMGIKNFTFNTINRNSANGSVGYQNFSCTNSTTVNIGQTYNVSITNGNQFAENVRIWIDYNNNGTFESNELAFNSTNKMIHTGTITIANNSVANFPLRLRVASDYYTNALPNPCGSVQYGQYEDYAVVVLANQPPVANFFATDTITCSRTVAFFDNSSAGPTSWKWYFGDGDSSSVQNPTHTYANAGTFTVTLKVQNANGNSTLVKTNYIQISGNQGPSAISCKPQTNNTCCGIGIYNVTFGAINNTTQPGTDGYKDYTCSHQTNVTIGNNVTLSVLTGSQYNENVKVWIDFNNNGVFANNELVLNSINVLTNHTANFTVPSNAVQNTPLRMRVISDFNQINTACDNVEYGQAEDYTVIALPNTVPPISNFTADVTTSCTGIINFTDNSQNAPTSWKWYFGDGDSSSVQNPTHTYTSSGLFTVILKVTNQFGTNTHQKTNYINITSTSGPRTISCKPATINHCCGIGIYNVTIGTINNTTQPGNDGYKDYTCTQNTNLNIASNYNLSVTTGTQYNENVAVWIDYNDDGSFNNTNELVMYSTNTLQYHTQSITTPTTAVMNKGLRMRVMSDYNDITASCNDVSYGQTEDYTVVLIANNNPPSPQFTVNFTTTCNGLVTFTDQSINSPTSWKWYFGDGDSSSVQNPSHNYTQTGVYSVTLVVTNQYGTNQIVKTNYINVTSTSGPLTASCNPITTGTCCGIGIYNVTFNTINKTTAPGTDSYQDYTCTDMTTVRVNNNYTISITTGAQYVENVNVWIDYDNNGIFANSELVLQSSALQYHTGNITIPASVPLYDKGLRMRVGSDYNSITNACTNLIWGQFEDYTVIVADPASVTNITENNHKITVYPNPSDGIFTIESTFDKDEKIELKVIDLIGKTVHAETGNSVNFENKKLDLSSIESGVYYLSIISGKQLFTTKLIIQ